MPTYDYGCPACRVVFEARLGVSESPSPTCPACGAPAERLFSPPNLNLRNFSSPTAARYAKVTVPEEIAREGELQEEYQKIWLPEGVKHNPWDEDHGG